MKKSFIIITLIFLFVIYLIPLSRYGLHGSDDLKAFEKFSYAENHTKQIEAKINQIYARSTEWNARIGEILGFSLGLLDIKIVYLIQSILFILGIYLILIYTFGKEKLKKINIPLYLLLIYLLMLIINPLETEVLFWYSGFMNHYLSIVIVLLIGLPYRNLLDGKDNLKKFNIKYFLYLLACLISGFNSETSVIVMICFMITSNIIYYKKNKKIDTYKILPVISLITSLIIFMSLQKNRIQYNINTIGGIESRSNMYSLFISNRMAQIHFTLITSAVYLVLYNLKIKNIKYNLIMLLISSISIIAMCFCPYYTNRGVYIFDIFVISYNIALIYNILNCFRNNKNIIITIITIFGIISYSYMFTSLFNKYNEFCNNREIYIKDKIDKNEEPVIETYNYKGIFNKFIYRLNNRLFERSEGDKVSEEYMEYRFYYYGKYKINWNN